MVRQISVCVLESRNLSRSSLIERNLITTLQVGSSTHEGPQVEVQDVRFDVERPEEEHLVLTLTNRQTRTVMYARRVPLRFIVGDQSAFWLSVYVPGDPRDSAFDDASIPRADDPQVQLSVKIGTEQGNYLLVPRGSVAMRPSIVSPGGDVSRASTGPEGNGVQAPVQQARDIKMKVAAMADAANKAHNAELHLSELQRQIEHLRKMQAQTEEELRDLEVRREAAEKHKIDNTQKVEQSKEVLRLRDVSLAEIRSVCKDAEVRLQQAVREKAEGAISLDTTTRGLGSEIDTMSSEMEKSKNEAGRLSINIEECSRRLQDLEARQRIALVSTRDSGSNALQEQIRKAVEELKGVERNVALRVEMQTKMEADNLRAREKLSQTQAVVEEARKRDAIETEKARAALDETSRELATHVNRMALLEGQVDENKNQLKDLQQYELELRAKAAENVVKSVELEQKACEFRDVLNFQVSDLDQTLRHGFLQDQRLEDLRAEIAKRQRELADADVGFEKKRSGMMADTAHSQFPEAGAELHAFLDHNQELEGMVARSRRQEMTACREEYACNHALKSVAERMASLHDEADKSRARLVIQEADTSHSDGYSEVATCDFERRELEESELRIHETNRRREELESRRSEMSAEYQESEGALQSALTRQEAHISKLHAGAAGEVDSTMRQVCSIGVAHAVKIASQMRLDDARGQLEEEETNMRVADDSLLNFRGEIVQISRQRAGLASVWHSAHEQLTKTQDELSRREVTRLFRERVAESSSSADVAREAKLQLQAVDLEQHVKTLESDVVAASHETAEIAALIVTKRGQFDETQAAIARSTHDIAGAVARSAASMARYQAVKAEQLGFYSNYELANKNAELDRMIECIDELEKMVMDLESRKEGFDGDWKKPLADMVATIELEENSTLMKEAQLNDWSSSLQFGLGVARRGVEVAEASTWQMRQRLVVSKRGVSNKSKGVHDLRLRAEEITGHAADAQARCTTRVAAAKELTQMQQDALAEASLVTKRKVNERDQLKEELREAKAQVIAHHQMLDLIRSDLSLAAENLSDSSGANGREKGSQLDSDDCRKEALLKEQLQSRGDALEEAEAEKHYIRVSLEDMSVELSGLKARLATVADKCAYQADHNSLQSSTIVSLEDRIRTVTTESEMLTVGLHDAEHCGETLKSENLLMTQQLEGIYTGSFTDFAAEMSRMKTAAEVQRARDELCHWKQIAKESEHELAVDVMAAIVLHKKIEKEIQARLDSLQERRQASETTIDERKANISGHQVHSVAGALHGLTSIQRSLTAATGRRKALVVACGYARSSQPLRGSTNDAWNMISFLRQSLQYREDQLRCLVESTDYCVTPKSRQPVIAGIMDGLRWLMDNAEPGDNLIFYFSGYGTEQPVERSPGSADVSEVAGGLLESFLVPCDFARHSPAEVSDISATDYRFLPLLQLSNMIAVLPAKCKMTVILDAHAAVSSFDASERGSPRNFGKFPRVLVETPRGGANGPFLLPRILNIPEVLMPATPVSDAVTQGHPICQCCYYTACQRYQWCSELSIEGSVQGAFTWAFIKAMIVWHLEATFKQHCQVLRHILADLQHHFNCIKQDPVVQLSSSVSPHDCVFLPEKGESPQRSPEYPERS